MYTGGNRSRGGGESKVGSELGSILRGAAVHCLRSCLAAGLYLDGFDGPSLPIIDLNLLHFCPIPINLMLGLVSMYSFTHNLSAHH